MSGSGTKTGKANHNPHNFPESWIDSTGSFNPGGALRESICQATGWKPGSHPGTRGGTAIDWSGTDYGNQVDAFNENAYSEKLATLSNRLDKVKIIGQLQNRLDRMTAAGQAIKDLAEAKEKAHPINWVGLVVMQMKSTGGATNTRL